MHGVQRGRRGRKRVSPTQVQLPPPKWVLDETGVRDGPPITRELVEMVLDEPHSYFWSASAPGTLVAFREFYHTGRNLSLWVIWDANHSTLVGAVWVEPEDPYLAYRVDAMLEIARQRQRGGR